MHLKVIDFLASGTPIMKHSVQMHLLFPHFDLSCLQKVAKSSKLYYLPPLPRTPDRFLSSLSILNPGAVRDRSAARERESAKDVSHRRFAPRFTVGRKRRWNERERKSANEKNARAAVLFYQPWSEVILILPTLKKTDKTVNVYCLYKTWQI